MKTDFKPGDKIEYCGIQASVVTNYGESGVVDIPGEGMMTWRWSFDGAETTRLVEPQKP